MGCPAQLRIHHLAFRGCSTSNFYASQWNIGRRTYLIYRSFVFLYWLCFFVIDLATNDEKSMFFVYISHWGQVLILVYLGFALANACYGSGKSKRLDEFTTASISGDVSTNDTTVSEGQDLNLVKFPSSSCSATSTLHGESDRLMWCHVATGVLFIVALNAAVIVSSLYPILEDPVYEVAFNASVINVNLHVINSALMIFEIFISAIPIFSIHFLYATVLSALYATNLLVLHWSGVTSAVYGSVDWANSPVQAFIVTIMMIFVAPLLSHGIIFSIFFLNNYLLSRCSSERKN